ncbi:chitobiase/beta-hexosaminidase C-terminal domain-containing protein [Terrimonas alba]|uniref:chitobiase/beta-hexosaminidase C-terminal domain-containing protein n=1 Tax=Terrimonas alba TaxID=3349636 RepID=UPI0035F398A9
MQRWKNYLFNASLALNCLLVFLLFFESKLSVPAWLQVTGRMHPLLLHFPLVLIVLYAIAVVVRPPNRTSSDDSYSNSTELLLLFAAFTAVITSLMGLFLSKEEGYDPEALSWHKWGGVAVSVFALLWYSFNKQFHAKKIGSVLTSAFALVLILFTGHQGAGITHGENFLLAPIMPEIKPAIVSLEEAVVFTDMVKPILEAKCESCHNSKKAKGELIMESEELLLKGGKSGPLWDSTEADLGLMLRRVHLPLDARKHMPPKGKPQLTEDEIAIMTQWIRKGADLNLRVADLSPTDTLHQLAVKTFTAIEVATYDFDEADPADVRKLNTVNRVVSNEALGSPALAVNFFHSNLFTVDQLKELNKIKKQIVNLDLAKMPVKDKDLELISDFENLRRLNLAFTQVTGAGLASLKKLKFLHTLTLSGTTVTARDLAQLQNFPELKTVYTWNTPLNTRDIEQLQKKFSHIRFETGYKGDTTIMKLSPPVLLNEESFISAAIPLKLKHYIQGTTIRYTTDGTDPDSLQSPVFKGDETISGSSHLKAKAFKAGWASSDIIEANFYKTGYTADTVIYLTRPDSKYIDEKGKLLINREKGEADFRFGGWVAYRENRMECLLELAKPEPVQSITLSSLIDIGSYIMPAQTIEVFGGNDAKDLKLIGRMQPEQPKKMRSTYTKGFECKLHTAPVKYLKLVVTPVAKLPSWHQGKGDKGWIFVDEVLVN